MGFIVSKVLLTLILPPASLLLLIVTGLVLARWRKAAGRALLGIGIVLLYALSLDPVADRLIRPLESFSRPFSGTNAKPDAVVVLGGGLHELTWVPAPAGLTGHSLQRLVAGITVARTLKLPLVVSGGTGKIVPGEARESVVMANTATALGFPRNDIVVETRSRNTLENAQFVREAIPGRTVVLVTSAFHMSRASGMFRKQGFTVVPAPACYLSEMRPFSPYFLLPRADALTQSSLAISEYLSVTWYSLTGRI